ncbi:MAG: nitroreductase family protein [Helicobacter sp.]|nr:nitroreductase family protein [Helicobacter sp.]
MDKQRKKEIFNEIFHQRFSCREFQDQDKEISKEDLEYILEAGRMSPSSLGLEPWRFIVAQKLEHKQAIASIAHHQTHFVKCLAIIVFVARLDFGEYFIPKLESRNISKEELQKRVDTYKPFIDGMDKEQKLQYAREQIFLPLMSMAYAATSLELNSCIIGGFDKDALDSYLKLDLKEKSVVLLAIGKAADNHVPKKSRFTQEEIVRYL